MIEIEESDLIELIGWARRYCDGRSTYAPIRFNGLYQRIRSAYMDKQTVHDGYKKILAHMLMDFYIDCTNSDMKLEIVADLNEFIKSWLDKHIKSPHQEWNPGDCGI